jgi:cobalamin synthase
LKTATILWFVVMAAGQWIFAYYILAYYGALTIQGGISAFADTHLSGGYIPGDTLGNATVVSHVFIAVIINGFETLQLIPA